MSVIKDYEPTRCDGAAKLHRVNYRCAVCGSFFFDHATDEPNKPYCLDCGEYVPRAVIDDIDYCGRVTAEDK